MDREVVERLVRIETKQDAIMKAFDDQRAHNDVFYGVRDQVRDAKSKMKFISYLLTGAWGLIGAVGAAAAWAYSTFSGRH